jgi:oxygen-independent coproporphyrinogen-3 oxidase|tara:strand:- start:1049 stop:2371 length:1323 start_codon:yes stop_codon:yes gene_type:complete
MWPYLPDLLARPVPRYTSFPTAAEFAPGSGAAEYLSAVAAIPVGSDISLYVHIPYCEQICFYCGCNTGRAGRASRLTAYLNALLAEIDLVASALDGRANIRRIAFGGGSPNAIAPTDFVRLVDALTCAFATGRPEMSVELDPRGFSLKWAEVLATIGVTHASLGVQTFSTQIQHAIGRVQPRKLILDTTALLRDAGVRSLNFDMMYGLPGQTENDLTESLIQAIDLGPDRVALFGYAHVPHLVPRQRQIPDDKLPDQKKRFEMAWSGFARLRSAGYASVGFDHFAKPGDGLAIASRNGTLRRNFQGFTDDRQEILLGLGASSISMFPGLIVQNEKNAGRYRMRVSAGQHPLSGGIVRSPDDRRRAIIIENILCNGKADISAVTLGLAGQERLQEFARQGLLDVSHDVLTLSAKALPYARGIAAIFDPYRTQEKRRFSNAI